MNLSSFKGRHRAFAVSLLVCLTAHEVSAQLFNFESTPATFPIPPQTDRPGALTSLSLTDTGLTLTISRQNSVPFDIVNNFSPNQLGKPAAFGARSLDPFFNTGPNTGFLVNFSLPITSFSMMFGDYPGDTDSITLQAFSGPDGTGTLVDTGFIPGYPPAFPIAGVIGVTGDSFMSVTWSGTSTFAGADNSLFYDNFQVVRSTTPPTGVPDAGNSGLMLAVVLAGLGIWNRRRN
jgi:hypothetical protein